MQSGCREMKTRIESSHACAHSRTNNDLCTTFTVPSPSTPPHHSIPTTTAADFPLFKKRKNEKRQFKQTNTRPFSVTT